VKDKEQEQEKVKKKEEEEKKDDDSDHGNCDSDDDEPPQPMEVNIAEIVKKNPLPKSPIAQAHMNGHDSAVPPPVYVIVDDTSTNATRVVKKKVKAPKSILDVIAKGLPQGLNENDREIQLQAMRVLSLFSLLDETRADRFISKMSTSSRKLFHAKYGGDTAGDKSKNKQNGKTTTTTTKNGGRKSNPRNRVHVDSPRPTSNKRNSLKKLFSLKEDSKLSTSTNGGGKAKKKTNNQQR